MAELNSYANDTTINDADRVIGSDSANSNVTRNFRMDDISDYVRGNVVLGDITTAVSSTELNILDGATVSTAELNILDGVTATATEINLLDGVTATTAELNYVDGVTSNIQTQLAGKQDTLTGAASVIASSNLTGSRALVSTTGGKVATSAITATEIGYLDGVTSSIQNQFNGITSFNPANSGAANQILQRTSGGYQWVNASAASYTLTAATSSALGGVIVQNASDIDIDSSGNLTLGNLSANKITSGVLDIARIPDITDGDISSALNSGNATDGYVLTADGSGATAWEAVTGTGHTIENNAGTELTQRANIQFASPLTVTDDSTNDRTIVDITLAASDIPNLNASAINAGTLVNERLSTDTPTSGQVLTYNSTNDNMEWTNKGSASLTFGTGGSEIATWAEGNNTTLIPTSKVSTDFVSDVTITSTDAGATVGPELTLFRDSASPANGDVLGRINFNADSLLGGDNFTHASIRSEISGSNSGNLLFTVARLGVDTTVLEANFSQIVMPNRNLVVTNTSDHANRAPSIELYRNSPSPADEDQLGEIDFTGENDADQKVTYATISGTIEDASDTTENGRINFFVQDSGSLNNVAAISDDWISVFNHRNDSTLGPFLDLSRLSDSPADNDDLGQVRFIGRNSASENTIYAGIHTTATDVTDGTEDATMHFTIKENGSDREILELTEDGATLTAGNHLALDLYETATGVGDKGELRYFAPDGSSNKAEMAAIRLQVTDTTNNSEDAILDFDVMSNGSTNTAMILSGDSRLTVQSSDTGASANPALDLFRNSSSPADNDVLGEIEFNGENSSSEKTTYANIVATADDITNATEDSHLDFTTLERGEEVTSLTLDGGVSTFRSPVQATIVLSDTGTALSNGVIADIGFNGNNSASQQTRYSRIRGHSVDVTDGSEDGSLVISNTVNGGVTVDAATFTQGSIIAGTGGLRIGGTGTANTLDDYEEGAWTPTVNGETITNIASSQNRYTKIGRLVHVRGRFTMPTTTNTGTAVINNLPFSGG